MKDFKYRRYHKQIKVVSFFLIVFLGLGVFYWQANKVKAENVGLWGTVDAKETNVNSKVAGRVVNLYVKEGDYVEKGQVIARIDRDSEEVQQKQAAAALASQYAQLRQAASNSDSASGKLSAALKTAEAQYAQAETSYNLAAKDKERYRSLLAAGAISQQTYDAYYSKYEQAAAGLNAAQAGVNSAQAALKENDANKAYQEAVKKQADALESQLDGANISLNETEIRAPYSGIVTQKFVEEGSLISSSVPICAIQDINDNWVDFKVKETDLHKFQLGDTVELTGRNDDVKITGTIESIRRKADFATQKATSERGETDVMAFNVKIRTDNASLWPGMRFCIKGKE